MRLLIVGPDIRDMNKVKNFTGIQAFYLARELRSRGVELHFINPKPSEPERYFRDVNGYGCDHVLAFGLRWFTHQPVGCASALKTKVPGKVTQLHDGVVHEGLAPHMVGVDCTFTFRDDSIRTRDWKRYAASNHYIGWAADPDMLHPSHEDGELRILVDHPYYKSGQPDITEAVTRDCVMFAHTGMWRDKFKSIKVRRLVNGGAEDVGLGDQMFKQFERKHVSFAEIAKEYRRTHVYAVTHKESVGLTCLETAFCGALTVAPKNMIYSDRLQTVRHIEHDGRVPWVDVLNAIDIKASVQLAREQSWNKVAERMLDWFEAHPCR